MTSSKVKPLGNRVLVKRKEAKASKGGILLPEAAQEKPKEGEILEVGPGKQNENGHVAAMSVKVGDHVLFSSYAGTEFKTEEEDYLILTEDEILGVIA